MDGIIVIDKPAGCTSRAVVEAVKQDLRIKKAGHTGTLDPLATGVLPVCVGEATKLVQFLTLHDKEYRATLLLGVRTDTLDSEGEVLTRQEPRIDPGQVEAALLALKGRRRQTPPLYSAVKFRGRPLYDWTRRGISVEQTPREVEIYEIRLELIRLPEVTFTVACSKGTYIRSLCAEVGEALGCGGCLSGLRRTKSGPFGLDRALAIGALPVDLSREALAAHMVPLSDLLPEAAAVDVDASQAERLRNGWQPDVTLFSRNDIPFLAAGDVIKITNYGRNLVAVARMLLPSEEFATGEEGRQVAKILRVFPDRDI